MPRFEAPVGPEQERNAGVIWPKQWIDSNPYGTPYNVKPGRPAIHTGADLNLKKGVDNNERIYAMGNGTVTYSGLYSNTAWGNLIVIYHGKVDGKLLYSRYGHVQGIDPTVKKDKTVRKGQLIARVGNGGPGLNFDPHLHFDISTTNILDGNPGYWPGTKKDMVELHFVDPYAWLINHKQLQDEETGDPATPVNDDTELRFAIQPEGVQVRKEPKTSSELVQQLKQGTQLVLKKKGGVKDKDFIWAQISGGEFDGKWVPVCKADQSVFYLSKNK